MRETRFTQNYVLNFFTRLNEIEGFRTVILPLLLLACAAMLWWVSLPNIDPGKMNDYGLVSVLPVSFYASLAIITISFFISIDQHRTNELILLLHLVVMIFILHGTPQIVYGTVRYSWAWKHAGIVDYIQRHGSVNPSIYNLNAYHNWPGFFALAAFYNQVAGIPSSLSYAGWGPVFFNLLDLGALLLIFKHFTRDRRLVWLGAWFFFLFSWIGQDYFSPQAISYFLYLITFAIVLKFFGLRYISSRGKSDTPHRPGFRSQIGNLYRTIVDRVRVENASAPQTSPSQRIWLMLILIMIFTAIASSHQLTPVMMISGLTALVLFQVTNQRYLPILMIVITTAWVTFMAVGFLNGNMYWIVKSIGSLLDNVNENLINLNVASHGQQIIAKVDRGLSVGVWVMGFLGLYRRYRSGYWDLPAFLLAISPVPVLAFNAYGGEMLFRVYLFCLPFITFFAAALFYPSLDAGTAVKKSRFAMVVSFLILPGFLFSYYGKERMYFFSPNEVAAAQFVYRVAPKGSLILDSTWDWPRQSVNYEYYNYRSLVRLSKDQKSQVMQDPVGTLSKIMNDPIPEAVYINETSIQPDSATTTGTMVYPAAYLVITRSQMAEAGMTGVLPAKWFSTIMDALSQAGNFRIVYQNPDATVYEFLHP